MKRHEVGQTTKRPKALRGRQVVSSQGGEILGELRKNLAEALPPLVPLKDAAVLAGWGVKTFYNRLSERSENTKGLIRLKRGRQIVFERENFLDWLFEKRIRQTKQNLN